MRAKRHRHRRASARSPNSDYPLGSFHLHLASRLHFLLHVPLFGCGPRFLAAC